MIIVSACLVGDKCRYNGEGFLFEDLKALVDSKDAIKVCPEVLGGLGTPRRPCEIVHKPEKVCVVDDVGNDHTKEFELGATKVLELCKRHNVTTAILKARSPSCGCGEIYDGNFSKTLINGDGITSAALKRNGIKVYTELNYNRQIK